MYERKFTITYNEILSILFFTFLFIAKGFGLYDGQHIFWLLIGVAVIPLVMKLLGERYSVLELLVCCVISILILYNYKLSYDKGLLLCWMMFLMVKNCQIDRICKAGAYVWGITGVLNYFLSVAGIHEGCIALHNKLGGEILRYSFGQPHPNVLHMTYFIFCCLFLYSCKNNRDRLVFWNRVLLIGSFILFLYTVSYTGVILSIIFYFGILHFQTIHDIKRMDWFVAYGVLICSLVSSIVVPTWINLENDRFRLLNEIFNTRLQLLNRYFDAYPVTAFGQWIFDYTRVDYQLDNSWAFLYLGGGVILFCCVCVIYFWGLYYILKQNRKMEMLIIVCLLLGGMTDPFLFNTSLKNIGLLFLGTVIYEKNCQSGKEKIVFLPRWNKYLNKVRELKIPYWKYEKILTMRLLVIIGVVALLAAWLVTSWIDMPQSYYVSTMDYPADGVTVTSEIVTDEILQEPSVKVYNYAGDGKSMWHVNSERIRKIEYMRTMIGVAIGIFLLEWMIAYIFVLIKQRKTKVNLTRE